MTPVSPSRRTIGKSSCESVIVRSSSCGPKPGAKSGISSPAVRTKSAVMAPSARVTANSMEVARRNASRRLPFSSCSVKTGTKAGCRAASANSARTRLGTWKAIVNADIGPLIPK